MAKGDQPERFQPHPILAKLVPDPAQPSEPTVRLTGYLGRSNKEASVRLYPTLDDLSHFVDIKQEDIVHSEAVPESAMEHGGTSLWVKASAQLSYSQVQTEKVQAQFVAGGITQAHLQDLSQATGAAEAQLLPTLITCRVTCFATCRVITCGATCYLVTCRVTCAPSCYRTCLQATCLRTCQVSCFRTCVALTCYATCFNTCICPVGGGDPFATAGCPIGGGGNPFGGGGDPFGGGGGIGGV